MRKTAKYYEMQMATENEMTPLFAGIKNVDELHDLKEKLTDEIFDKYEELNPRDRNYQKNLRPLRVELAKVRIAYKHRFEVIQRAVERGLLDGEASGIELVW